MAAAPSSGRYRHSEHASFRRVGAETVLIDVQTGAYFALNETGSLAWERLGQGRTPQDILEEILREYDAPPDRARADLNSLLESLLRARLLLELS